MSWLWTIIIGLLAGVLAKFLVPGKDPGGIIVTILLGIVGSIVATLLGQAVGWYPPGSSTGLIGSTVGAILILAVYRWFNRQSRHSLS
jgi:uncharacterized membrane protein YeaQ/YmgE (transglycosylase-associated protein family)